MADMADRFIHLRVPEGKDHRTDVLLPRWMAMAHLDALYLDAPLPSGLHLSFFNHGGAGFGDIAFAWKATQLLRQHAPELGLTLVTTAQEKTGRFDFGDVPIIADTDFESRADERARRPDLWLAAPTLYDGYAFEETDYPRFSIPGEVPYLFISEYGQIRYLRKVQEAGISALCDAAEDSCFDRFEAERGRGNVGFDTRNQNVLVFAEDGTHGVVGNFRLALAKDEALRAMLTQPRMRLYPCGLETGEMGILVDDRLREGGSNPQVIAELEHPSLRKQLLEPGGSLYYGYAHSGVERFLSVIGLLEERHSRRIDVVVPLKTAPDATAEKLDAATRERLQTAGIGKLVIVDDSGQLDLGLGQGKTMRLLTYLPLENRDVHRLLRASEAATMVSGDQSTSEAVSAGKWLVISEPYYCQTWVTDALLGLAEQWPGVRTSLDYGVSMSPAEADWAAVRSALEDPQLPGRGQALAEHICTHHRANERVAGLVKRTLLEDRRPELVSAERDLLADAYDNYSLEGGIRLSRARLDALYELIRS